MTLLVEDTRLKPRVPLSDSPVPTGLGWVLFDLDQDQVIDNLNVPGVQGAGARRVVVEEVFVPEHRVMLWGDALGTMVTEFPGLAVHANPLYFLHRKTGGKFRCWFRRS